MSSAKQCGNEAMESRAEGARQELDGRTTWVDYYSLNGEITFFGRLLELCFQANYFRIFLYLFFSKKCLQTRYFLALFRNYLFEHGISVIHIQLRGTYFSNWLFYGNKFSHVVTPNVKVCGARSASERVKG